MDQIDGPEVLSLDSGKFVSAGTQAADLPKAVVVSDPPGNRVLTLDSVTFKCQGDNPSGNHSTRWLHNGTLISSQTSYVIEAASVENSGEYRCQTGLSELSDPVQLEVLVGWLLLQTPRRVFQVGEPIRLRCHSWKNKPVWNVQYFQNRRGRKFSYDNSEFYIPAARSEHNGSYFCRGLIGKKNESSEAVDIIIQGPPVPSTSALLPFWPHIPFAMVMALLFAVDTVLYFAMRRDLHNSKRAWKNSKVSWKQGP
ncbi:low affinity immunoglobulin gamma Fc region receptor III-like isoform X1 [Lontra canadensis]|uniref:low affinity immunoglobulin gamma Fc region receptor III-like isoform X1 n=1 Tax=Lontra canadensis TaxID=76717 RepID=UPI0013F2B962|nr:low affinity immunoglobulin gamma Fc region receptor III-like isoform X1 [Lontra canadensis]